MVVVSDILAMIRRGELPLLSALPSETELCARFQVSRTRVREAVKYLQGKGLLRVEHGRGTWIEPVDHWDLLDAELWTTALAVGDWKSLVGDLVETRRMLETQIVARASVLRSSGELRTLEHDLGEMDNAIQRQNVAEYNGFSRRFHDHLAIAARNVLLVKFSRSLNNALELTKQAGHETLDVARLSFRGHQAILDAVRRGDPTEACEAMLHHLSDFGDTLRNQVPSLHRLPP